MELDGAVALVTGGGTRVGRGISTGLAARGASIAIHYRSSGAEAEAAAEEIRSRGGDAACFRADLTLADQIDGLIPAVLDHFGKLDILVNSASVYHPVSMDDTDRAEWEENMMIHAWAPFRLAQLMMRELGDRPGKIININDAQLTRPRRFAYGVSKAALSAVTRSLASAAPIGVQVNELALGAILPPSGLSDERVQRLASTIPARRWGSVEEVVQAIVALVQNDYINAETINIDGGASGARR